MYRALRKRTKKTGNEAFRINVPKARKILLELADIISRTSPLEIP